MEDNKLKIMVIEDEELLLEAIARKINMSDMGVVTCKSARQAIDYLKNLPQLPDLIWLDYYLDDMSGLDFVKEIKKVESWGKIPIIVVSNSASEIKKQLMLELGVKQFLLKADYRLDDIIKIIRDQVKA
jgi:DNA-binding response OmpR family regulator